jgi:Rrf2 family protein
VAHYGTGVEYALHCLLHLVRAPADHPPSSRDLADFQGLPAAFVAKLFSDLEKAGIVTATEGLHGGFRLARAPQAITVLEVVDAVEGEKRLFRCREVRQNCVLYRDGTPAWAASGVCTIHAVMLDAEKRMRETLAATTLGDLVRRVAAKVPAQYLSDKQSWFAERRGRRKTSRPKKENAT